MGCGIGVRTRAALVWLGLGLVACGDTGGCGGAVVDPYPRQLLEATPSPQAIRARMTQSGLDALADGFPDMVASGCAEGSETCALDPNDPNRVRFFFGDGTDFGVGSYVALDMDSFRGNVHMRLFTEPDSGGGISMDLGCNQADLGNCTAADYITGSMNLILYDSGLLGSAACLVRDKNDPGFIIESLSFLLRPVIQRSPVDQKPYLVLDGGATTQRAAFELDVEVVAATNDPMCGSGCSTYCGTLNVGTAIGEFLINSGFFAETLAEQLAQALADQFSEEAMEAEGSFGLGDVSPVGNTTANPVQYLIGATPEAPGGTPPLYSPEVTGAAGVRGWNFDLDAGFHSAHSPCVPTITPPSFVLPPPPDVGAMVQVTDAETSASQWVPFDLALMVGRNVVTRATYEMFDGGSLCINLKAEEMADLSGGAFVPTVQTMSLLAPGLTDLSPGKAPVDLRIVPRLPPVVRFGEGTDMDAHMTLIWPSLWLEMYPLVDEVSSRAVTAQMDLHMGLNLIATPTGDLTVMVVPPSFEQVSEAYNEMTSPFDAEGLAVLLDILLPMVFDGQPIDVGLSAATLGMPFAPKLLSVQPLDKEYLGIFLHLCTAGQIADPTHALCYQDPAAPGAGNSAAPGFVTASLVRGPGVGDELATVRVSAHSDLAAGPALELAYRVDETGPWFTFTAPDEDGLYSLVHPSLVLPGEHRLRIIARDAARPWLWSQPIELTVETGGLAPTLRAGRDPDGVWIEASDDLSAPEAIRIGVEIEGPLGVRSLPWAWRDFVELAPDERVTLWAMDEADNVSAPLKVEAWEQDAVAEPALPLAGGCAATGPGGAPSWVWLGLLAWLWRRTRGAGEGAPRPR